jgi:hypothetical protein
MPQPAIPPPPSGTLVMPPNNIPPPPSGTIIPSSSPAATQPGNAFTSGHFLDTVRANLDQVEHPQPTGSVAKDMLNQFGRAGAETLVHPIVHPLDTLSGLGTTVKNAFLHSNQYDPENPVNQMIGSTVKDYQDLGPARATAHLAGQLGTGLLAGEMGGEVAEPVMRGLGRGSEAVGESAINHAVGATPKMMRYGANPARGMVDSGVATIIPRTLTKAGMAGRVAPALDDSGQAVGDAVRGGTPIPSSAIASSIRGPIIDAENVAMGPGGNQTVGATTKLGSSMQRIAPKASGPIFGPKAPPNVSANDLWQTIRNVDRNTRFNPNDPEVEGVNEVRRSIRGGLRGNLEDAVPGLKPISQRYSDLVTADDALGRTANQPQSLGSLTHAAIFPGEMSAGTALVKGGRLLQGLAPAVKPGLFMTAVSPKNKDNQ